MAVTWSISTLERNNEDGGVVVAHWRAFDSEVVGDTTHTGSSYGTVSFEPDSSAEGYLAYDNLTEEVVIQWVKSILNVEGIEDLIAVEIAESKAPATSIGVPWAP